MERSAFYTGLLHAAIFGSCDRSYLIGIDEGAAAWVEGERRSRCASDNDSFREGYELGYAAMSAVGPRLDG